MLVRYNNQSTTILLGLWAGLIPSVKELYGLSNTVLGGILVAAVAGGILCLPVAAYGVSKQGSAKTTCGGAIILNCLAPISKLLI